MNRYARYWLPVLAYAGLIFWLSTRTAEEVAPLLPVEGLDKVAHFLEFGGLALLVRLALRHGGFDAGARLSTLVAIAFALLFGVSDELHQHLNPEAGRVASLWDVAADLAGALTFALAHARRERRRATSTARERP